MVSTRQRERQNTRPAAPPADEQQITTDPTDPATITKNNGSGPIISDAEKSLLDGLGLTGVIDLAAPITERPISTRGRASKLAQDPRVQRIIRGLTDELPEARAAWEEGNENYYQGFGFLGTNKELTSAKNVLGTWAKGKKFTLDDDTKVTVSVSWDKSPHSPNTASTQAKDADKPVIYFASLDFTEVEPEPADPDTETEGDDTETEGE